MYKVKIDKKIYNKLKALQSRPQYTNYYRFLKSKYWDIIRKIVLKRDKYRCTVCGYKYNLQIHHTTYKHLYNEHNHIEDLLTVCGKYHYEFHITCEVK